MPIIIDLTAPKIARGRLTNFRTGDSFTFPLNPSSAKVDNSSNIANDSLPGQSDPLLRWMSGKGRTVTFTIMHDGEMTLRVLGSQFVNGAALEPSIVQPTIGTGRNTDLIDDPQGYSISAALQFLDSFTYPVDPREPGSDGAADRIVFSFGSYFRSIVCTVDKVIHDITEFDPDLNPTRAKTDLTLTRYRTSNVFSSAIWSPK